VVHEIDDFDLEAFACVASRFGQDRYGYVVTPNVDHLVRYHEDSEFRRLYKAASYVLLDSRFACHLFRIVKGIRLPVCTGADLTKALLSDVVEPSDRVVLLGASDEQAEHLASRYGLRNVRHFNPPMGFIKNPTAVEDCLQFVESASPFRFCFLAVGCPQQEIIAERLLQRGTVRGLALCVGASLNFLTGAEPRAPKWVQHCGFEWMFRLIQNPKRMAYRYFVRGSRIFLHVWRARVVQRRAGADRQSATVDASN